MALLKVKLAAVALLSGAALSPVKAQFFHGPPILPERAIVDLLREDGFRRVAPPVLNRDVYLTHAIDPYGAPVRVVVGAYDGRILAAHLRRGGAWIDDDPFADDLPEPMPRARPRPPRQALATPPSVQDRPAQPAPQPRQPATVLRGSPTAIPKDKAPVPPSRPEATAQTGTKTAPRVIEMTPPAPLDEAARPKGPETPPVPPAPLD